MTEILAKVHDGRRRRMRSLAIAVLREELHDCSVSGYEAWLRGAIPDHDDD